ncbi:MAG: LCP family protein, partial [Firmicutes bacterium]|nr:LCP family protein [Bacillota bacterium]
MLITGKQFYRREGDTVAVLSGKRVGLLLLLLVLCLIFWLGSVWVRIYDRPPAEDMPAGDGTITNVLIVGIDQREDEPSRADTIIILSINEANGDTALVSVPRDSRVEIPGRGLDKINHAMQFGGIALLRRTVATLLDVPLEHYLYTNFTGFASIVDAVGGVEIDVERPVPVPGGPALKAGPRLLNGREALAYVRFRSDAEGDFGRMRRQRQVLTAIGR